MLTISMTKNKIKNKVYDCITFYQANMLFQLRFEILKDVVDYFVICEANKSPVSYTHLTLPTIYSV